MIYRALRGGSYYIGTGYLRITGRDVFVPVYRLRCCSFRVVVRRTP